MKVLFAGTPTFAVPPLKALSEAHDIIGVFTQPDRKSGRGKKVTASAVKLAAQEIFSDRENEVKIHQPKSLRDQQQIISDLCPDVMVVVAYGMLLPQSILDIPRLGCINIHASLLPRWRGAAPIHRAIEAGDRESGVAIMKMELGLDTGPVYQTLKTPIHITDTTSTLHDRHSDLGAKGIVDTLNKLEANPNYPAAPQNSCLATYAKILRKEEANIEWSKPAQSIHQQIRAFIPFPVSQCHHQQTRMRIWQASVIEADPTSNSKPSNPGKIVEIDTNGVVVQCGEGLIRLEIFQRDGGKPLPWSQFRNGYALELGDQFN